MNDFLEPNYTILTFFLFKTFFFVEIVGALAIVRIFTASGPSRRAATGAAVLALLTIAAKYGPPIVGITDPDILRATSRITNQGLFYAGSGMALPICVSVMFGWSWFLDGRRWWMLDALHLLVALSFFSLWIYTLQ